MSQAPTLDVTEISAAHGRGSTARQVLTPTSCSIPAGRALAVVGRSGAGKSTLANVLLGLHRPLTGTILVEGHLWCSETAHPAPRLRHLVQGIPQDPGAALIPRWNIRRTITHALRRLATSQLPAEQIEERIQHAAAAANLAPELLDRRPDEISGGQAQRAAIARALAVGPRVLVADEPTSALDPATSKQVTSSLLRIAEEHEIALLIVTHDPEVAAECHRTMTIHPPEGSR